jgi:ABC-2 type transport system ATP-binding protein
VNVVEVCNLGKRYGKHWAIKECSLSIPSGHVVALVGPNGAGKTTLLHCAVGLVEPSTGYTEVFGGLEAGSPEALARIAFVAQDAPLYKYLTVDQIIELTRNLNRGFDTNLALHRLDDLGIDPHQKVGRLSGGQQSQLALALAIARHPDLLVLDEPLARLDPLARNEFMGVVMAAVAEDGLSVVLSSHVVSELERVANYLIVLNVGRLQIASEIDELLENHLLLTGPVDEIAHVANSFDVVQTFRGDRQARLLVRSPEITDVGPNWEASQVSLEELILAYLRDPHSSALSPPVAHGTPSVHGVRS